MSEIISLKDFCLLKTLEQENGIECMTEIEDGHLAVWGNQKNINIFPQRIDNYNNRRWRNY